MFESQYKMIQRTRESLFQYCETMNTEDYIKEMESSHSRALDEQQRRRHSIMVIYLLHYTRIPSSRSNFENWQAARIYPGQNESFKRAIRICYTGQYWTQLDNIGRKIHLGV